MSRLIAKTPRFLSKAASSSRMSAFTLYGARGSTNTDRVRLTLAEAGFNDYDLVYLELYKGEQKSADNLSRHPWGKVPSVTFPNGFTLYESRAICKYLTKKYSFPLLPSETDLEATALFDQAQSVEMLYFLEPAGKISFEKYVKKLRGLPTDDAAVEAALKALETFLDVLDSLLQQREWMAGESFTLVDIYYIPLIQRLFGCGYQDVILQRKHVAAWWDRVTSRSAISQLMAADREAAAAARK